jgi:hypothetical protein
MSDRKVDEFGHLETQNLPGGAVAAIVTRDPRGGVYLSVALDGHPEKGFDLIFWYDDFDTASEALQIWDYPNDPSPPGCKRDLQLEPLLPEEM